MSRWRQVQEALYQRFEDQWVVAGEPKCPYVFGNEGFDPPNGPWCRVSVKRLPGGAGTMGKPGNRKMDRRGVVYIQHFEPPGDGVGRASDLAEESAKIYENCRMLEQNDIRFGAVEPSGDAGESESDGGRWWLVVVEGPFDYEDLR